MLTQGFALFETAIGWCGVAWGERGIVGVQLPERAEAATRARLGRRFPEAREGAPPAEVRSAIEAMTAMLGGEPADLGRVQLDLDGLPAFERRVYELAREIPPGTTLTYGELAARLGQRGAAREVGQALGRNPLPILVPCHRVLAADGKLGGFSAHGGARTKRRLLGLEGVPTTARLPLFERPVPTAGRADDGGAA